MSSKALTATEIADLIEEGRAARREHLRWADKHKEELLARWRAQQGKRYDSYVSPED